MINFTATLKEHSSFRKNLKYSNPDVLSSDMKKVIDAEIMQIILGDDVIELKAKKHKSGDYVVMNCNGLDVDIQSRNEVKTNSLIHQLLVYCCVKYGVHCNLHGQKGIEKTLKKLLDKAQDKQ